jgi:hypothetical protein
MRFSLDRNSSLFRWLRLGADSAAPAADAVADPVLGDEDPFLGRRGATDDASILPGRDEPLGARAQDTRGRRRDWRMDVSYALTRPRHESAFQETSQNLRFTLSTQPTELWSMSWRTSYDVEGGQFSDHMVTFTRDLHRWQAHFDFTKTATGNWAFRFEVSLLDNSDLRFDFDQRSAPQEIQLPPP